MRDESRADSLPSHPSSLITHHLVGSPRGQHLVVARVAAGEEPLAAAEAVEPPLLLGSVQIAPGVEVRGPRLIGSVTGRARMILAAEAELGDRPRTAIGAME